MVNGVTHSTRTGRHMSIVTLHDQSVDTGVSRRTMTLRWPPLLLPLPPASLLRETRTANRLVAAIAMAMAMVMSTRRRLH
jgi:hypothetical protein